MYVDVILIRKSHQHMTIWRIYQNMVRTRQWQKTVLHLTLKENKNPYYNQQDLAKPPSTKYHLLWSSWKPKLPFHQYFEYASDNCQCFCLFTMVACYTLRNLSHAQSLDDTLSRSSVLSFCTVFCAPKQSIHQYVPTMTVYGLDWLLTH